MPLYSFRCDNCYDLYDEFRDAKGDTTFSECKCGGLARRVYTPPALITETSFCMTGKHHISVCDPKNKNDLIKGRDDWNKRLKQKNLRVLDRAELEPKTTTPKLSF